jgi:glutamyl-tRNA synthetase
MRVEDLDLARCKPEFVQSAIDDLHWLGIAWQEGPDVGGPFGPYVQSERGDWYLQVWQQLAATGWIYPSPHSRKDVQQALQAPHEGEAGEDAELIFPASLRAPSPCPLPGGEGVAPGEVNWRFCVPDGRVIEFTDGQQGLVRRTAGVDFGDFLVWRKDGFPSYELAVVADDHAMQITEVVRGEDLLTSTARQLLLYEALGWTPPAWFHCPLVRDEQGKRLAKRDAGKSLKEMREKFSVFSDSFFRG